MSDGLRTTPSSSLRDALRRAKDAATRVDRAATFLRHEASEATPNSERRWLIGYEAENLLWNVLRDAHSLVDLLNDDQGDGAEAAAKTVYEALRARRLAAKLDDVEGRTPEEAAAFQAKARELRGE